MTDVTTTDKPTTVIGMHQVAATFTLIFPAMAIVNAVLFVLLESAHPEYMTTRGVVVWGLCFAGWSALTIAAAITAYRTLDREPADMSTASEIESA